MIFNITLLITIILNGVYDFTNKSLSIILWGVLFVIVIVPHLLMYNTGLISIVVLDQSALFMIFFNLMYLITKLGLIKKVKISLGNAFIKSEVLKNEKLSSSILVLVYSLSFLAILYGLSSRGLNIMSFTWAEGNVDTRSEISHFASIILLSVSGVGAITFYKNEKFKFALSSMIYLLYVLIFRSRYNIIPYLVPFFYALIYSCETKKLSGRYCSLF